MYKYTLTDPSTGYEVYVNMITSSAGQYLSRQPYVLNVLKEALHATNLKGSHIYIERDMGRIIGNTDIVETTDADTIYYAMPIKKKFFARFAKNRAPLPSNTISIILEKDDAGNFEVLDAWIGLYSPPFPGDERETPDSKEFWATHALVQDAKAIQSKSITKTCPY